MFRDPGLVVLQIALLLVPGLILAWLGNRLARSPRFSVPLALALAVSASLPLCWVLATTGVGHGGVAVFLPAWWVLIASTLFGTSGALAYPSL